MNWIRWAMAILAMACFVACKKPENSSLAQQTNAAPIYPTSAQPRLQTLKLWLGAQEITAELALTGLEIQTGMMFRTNMPENEGMLFVFPYPYRTGFWMKNTILPLSCAYIDPEGVILELHDLKPHDTNSVTAASDRIQYVLETNRGWFERKKVEVGMLIRTEKGSLKDTFFGRH